MWIQWLCPPCPNRGLRQAIAWPSCAKSRFLLSSHTFCDKFLCVPGRPVSFRNYGIPGLPVFGHICQPITTPPKSSTNVWKGIIKFICVLSCILMDSLSQTIRSDTFCTNLPCVLNHGMFSAACFKDYHLVFMPSVLDYDGWLTDTFWYFLCNPSVFVLQTLRFSPAHF